MAAPYSAKAIANYFLDLARSKGEALSPMKLQKLIYFAHGWHLAIHDKPLINEQIQAWQYGPVINSLYHEFKHSGSGEIKEYASTFLDGDFIVPNVPEDDLETRRLLEKVWNVYSKFTAVQLSNMTHAPDSPWDKANKKNTEGMSGYPIDNNEIKQYFLSKFRT